MTEPRTVYTPHTASTDGGSHEKHGVLGPAEPPRFQGRTVDELEREYDARGNVWGPAIRLHRAMGRSDAEIIDAFERMEARP